MRFVRALLLLLCLTPLASAGPPPALAPLATPATPQVPALTLDQAVKRALSANRPMQSTRMGLRSARLNYDDAWDRMFLPTISLTVGSTSAHTFSRIPNTQAATLGDASRARGYPTTTASLTVGNYTLFNFWKDRMAYDTARMSYEREEQKLLEAERALRFQVVGAYFKLKTDQDKLEASRRSMDISEALAELVKSRKAVGKATENDVSSAVVDLLNARNQYIETESSIKADHWELNLLLADPMDAPYRLTSPIPYNPLKVTAEDVIKIYLASSPTQLDGRMGLRNAEATLELAEKNRLPLPTVAINGLTVSYTHGYFGGKETQTTSGSTPGNLEISTSISLTVPLLGVGGIFSGRDVARARITHDQTELAFVQTGYSDQKSLYSSVASIKQQEASIANLKEQFASTTGVLERLFSNAANGVPRLELRDALVQARQSELTLKDAYLSHLTAKLSLAQTIGVDQLPGDPF